MDPLTDIVNLGALPETDAVRRAMAALVDDPHADADEVRALRRVYVWCVVRDEERTVVSGTEKARCEAFTIEWADYPQTFTHDQNVYRKWPAYWTVDGAGPFGGPGRVQDDTVRDAWKAAQPKPASVTVLGEVGRV